MTSAVGTLRHIDVSRAGFPGLESRSRLLRRAFSHERELLSPSPYPNRTIDSFAVSGGSPLSLLSLDNKTAAQLLDNKEILFHSTASRPMSTSTDHHIDGYCFTGKQFMTRGGFSTSWSTCPNCFRESFSTPVFYFSCRALHQIFKSDISRSVPRFRSPELCNLMMAFFLIHGRHFCEAFGSRCIDGRRTSLNHPVKLGLEHKSETSGSSFIRIPSHHLELRQM